jgi:protein-tyrosine phosphatase
VHIPHLRLPVNDFDPFNLRLRLPQVIKHLAAAHKEAGGTAYIHCTAGNAPP